MNIEDINLGDPPTGAGGDTMRTAFGKTNQNFGAAKQALEDEVQTREQLLATQRDQLIALIESANGPLPALRADFKSRSFGSKNAQGMFLPCGFEDIFTFSRPSPKWVWNSHGELVRVPPNEPAYQHDPLTGQPLGILFEAASTNGHNNGKLANSFSDYSLVEANDPYLPDAKVVTDSVGHPDDPFHTSLGSVYPFGTEGGLNQLGLRVIYARNDKSRYVGLRTPSGAAGFTFDLLSEDFVPGSVQLCTPMARKLRGGWWELSFARDWATATNNQYWVNFGTSADGIEVTSQVGDQIALAYPGMYDTHNPTPGSIIITDGSSVTREADAALIEDVGTSDWWGAEGFTLFADIPAYYPNGSTYQTIVGSNGTSNSLLNFNGQERFRPILSSGAPFLIGIASGAPHKVAISCSPSGTIGAADGDSVSVTNVASDLRPPVLEFGRRGAVEASFILSVFEVDSWSRPTTDLEGMTS